MTTEQPAAPAECEHVEWRVERETWEGRVTTFHRLGHHEGRPNVRVSCVLCNTPMVVVPALALAAVRALPEKLRDERVSGDSAYDRGYEEGLHRAASDLDAALAKLGEPPREER